MFKFLICTMGYEWDWYVADNTDIPDVVSFPYEHEESQYSHKHEDIKYINSYGDMYDRIVEVRYSPTWEEWCAIGWGHTQENTGFEGSDDILFRRKFTATGWLKTFETWEDVQAFLMEHDAWITPTEYKFSDGSPVMGLVV